MNIKIFENGETKSIHSFIDSCICHFDSYRRINNWLHFIEIGKNINSDKDNGSVLGVSATRNTYYQDGGTVKEDSKNYNAVGTDNSAVVITNGSSYTLNNSTIVSSSDTSVPSSNTPQVANAAVVAKQNSQLNLTNTTVRTDGIGASAVFATDAGTNISLGNVSINTTANSSPGIVTSAGAITKLSNINVSTNAVSSPAIYTDKDGIVTATGTSLSTYKTDSPAIFNYGNSTFDNSKFNTNGYSLAIINGGNLTFNDSELESRDLNNNSAIVINGTDVNIKSVFTINDGSIKYIGLSLGPLIKVNNSNATINLNRVLITNNTGDILNATSERLLNKTPQIGSVVTINTNNQNLSGNIIADRLSSINLVLRNNTNFMGNINSNNSAKNIDISLDSTSEWRVTKNSYVSSFSELSGVTDNTISNIFGNGHDIYYDSKNPTNKYLNGKTYDLTNGGSLKPM